MTKTEIAKARHSIVVKSNELIQKSRFELSAIQNKVILYLISKIKPEDEEFKLYEFSIHEFCQVCGIEEYSGGNYAALKKAIKEIADKSMWVTLNDGSETLVRFIERPYIERNSGIIKIKLDELMKPYLLQLQESFTQYELIYTIRFKGKYSIRLYELIKSVHYNELSAYERIFTLEDLKTRLGAGTSYSAWKNFKARVLEPAIMEINEHSDKHVEYEAILEGKSVNRIRLKIKSKNWLEANKEQEIL
jgi:plasmid replication initiation protein